MNLDESATPGLPTHPPSENDCLLWLHIPKTAGITLSSLIDPLWRPEARCPLYFPRELQGIVPETLDRYRSFSGHFNFTEIAWLVGRPLVSMTMLRDPVERYLSNFLHLKYKPPFQARPIVARELPLVRELSLQEFMARDDLFIPRDIANMQTRMLGAPLDPASLSPSRAEPYFGMLDRARMSPQAALANLRGMACFGLTERFQDSLFMYAFTFGWKPLYVSEKLNPREPAAEQEPITATSRERMRALNAMDIELYDSAVQLFDERMRAMCKELLGRYGTSAQALLKYPLPPETLGLLLDKHHAAVSDIS